MLQDSNHSSDVDDNLVYKIDKGWQTQDFEFVLTLRQARQKLWMHIYVNTSGLFKIKFEITKPQIVSWQANFIQLWRKYLPGGALLGIYEVRKEFFISFQTSGGICFLVLNRDHEYELVVNDSTGRGFISIIRWANQSVYTVKKEFKDNGVIQEIINQKHKNILFDIINQNKSLEAESNNEKDILVKTQKNDQERLDFGQNEDLLSDEKTDKQKSKHQKQLLFSLKKRKKTLKKAYDKIKASMVSEEKLEELKSKAFYLKENFYKLKNKKVELDSDLDSDSEVLFEGQDIDKEFIRYKKAQKNYKINSQKLEECLLDINSVDSAIERLQEEILSPEELLEIETKNKIVKRAKLVSRGSNKNEKASFCRVFMVDGTNIYVGKDSKTNDILTKGLKSNDYWFHVVSRTGSHVAIKNNGKELTSKLIQSACILALFFSESHPREGSVYFCQRMNLKNTPTPGLWKVLRSKIIDLSYTDQKLSDILSTEVK